MVKFLTVGWVEFRKGRHSPGIFGNLILKSQAFCKAQRQLFHSLSV